MESVDLCSPEQIDLSLLQQSIVAASCFLSLSVCIYTSTSTCHRVKTGRMKHFGRRIERTQLTPDTRTQCTMRMSRQGVGLDCDFWWFLLWKQRDPLCLSVISTKEQQALQKQATELRRMKKRQRQMTPRHKECGQEIGSTSQVLYLANFYKFLQVTLVLCVCTSFMA